MATRQFSPCTQSDPFWPGSGTNCNALAAWKTLDGKMIKRHRSKVWGKKHRIHLLCRLNMQHATANRQCRRETPVGWSVTIDYKILTVIRQWLRDEGHGRSKERGGREIGTGRVQEGGEKFKGDKPADEPEIRPMTSLREGSKLY